MTDKPPVREIKSCCASFYENDLVRMFLGDVLHPGGLELTDHLGAVIGLTEADKVLDVACGRGTSAVHLAKSFGCHVTGVDYGRQNTAAAKAHAAEQGVSHLTAFCEGDAERLPFDDGAFDAVVSECSFCTFPNKEEAAAEMGRVLGPGGRLGLTDITVNGRLPDDLRSLLAWVSCVAGALGVEDYAKMLKKAGFTGVQIEDQRNALVQMVGSVRRKLLVVEAAVKLGRVDLGNLDLDKGKELARRAVELIEGGLVGYALIAAQGRAL